MPFPVIPCHAFLLSLRVFLVTLCFPSHSMLSALLYVFIVTLFFLRYSLFSALLHVFRITLSSPCHSAFSTLLCDFHVPFCFPCYSMFSALLHVFFVSLLRETLRYSPFSLLLCQGREEPRCGEQLARPHKRSY